MIINKISLTFKALDKLLSSTNTFGLRKKIVLLKITEGIN